MHGKSAEQACEEIMKQRARGTEDPKLEEILLATGTGIDSKASSLWTIQADVSSSTSDAHMGM